MKIVKRVIISIVVIVILVIAFLFFISSRDMWFSKGRCLITKNNEYILIMDKSPYRMSTSNKSMFKGLDNGDEIIALTGVFLDSYPGQVGVYFVLKTADGDISDISVDVLTELTKRGWIDESILPDELDLSEAEEYIEEEVSLINPDGMTVETRIITPEGYTRTEITDDENFTNFVRNYPVKEDGSPVLLYSGSQKRNQSAHVAVLELPIEAEDLQQCADSIMRMYAEYYYVTGQYDNIKFHFVNGFLAEYSKWRDGYRISFSGNDASWVQSASFDDSYTCFQKYMRIVFSYAGTLSMENESESISLDEAKVGDVFLKGGSPGHVVMILDVCENEQGERAYLLAQGYMPAQEFHILKNPLHENDPWYYECEITYPLQTPEYTFPEGSLKRLNY